MKFATHAKMFWAELAPRERYLIGIGLTILLPLALYLYVWQPVQADRERLAIRGAQLRGELEQLRADSAEIKRLRAQAPIDPAVSLERAARQAAARFGLPEQSGVSSEHGKRLQVDLDNVAFDAWLRWLGELGAQGIGLAACEVEALPASGQVRVKATLIRQSI